MKTTIITPILMFFCLQLMAIHPDLQLANSQFDRLAYSQAIETYKKYLDKHDQVEAWIKLAECYNKLNDYDNLNNTLLKIVLREDLEDATCYLKYALVLQIKDKHNDAIEWFEKYLESYPEDQRAINQLESCRNPYNNTPPYRYEIENMPFNTEYFEYAPNFLNNTLLYISTEPVENTSDKTYNWTNGSYSDLRQYEQDDTEVMILFNEIKKLNTDYNDGPFTVDPLTKQVYYTRNNYSPSKVFNKRGFDEDRNMNLKIYVAEQKKGVIGEVSDFEHNFEDYNTGHPTISPDGKYMVFVCDVPGENIGGRDLYFCSRIEGLKWSPPTLLTSEINTEGDELFPHFHEDGTLYLSSDGLGSIGGLDIFHAEIDFEENKLIKLERMPYPLNTTYDDFGLIFKDEFNGYFASDRADGKGSDDIYSFNNNTILLKGIVVNDDNNRPIPGSQIKIGNKKITLLEGNTDGEARFETTVLRNEVYHLFADEDLFLSDTEEVSTVGKTDNKTIHVKLRLTPIKYTIKVVDAKTKKPVQGAVVNIKLDCNQTEKSLITLPDGTYELPVAVNCQYHFKAKAEGYLAKNKDWKSPKEDKNAKAEVIIEIEEISFEPIVLRSIYYDFDKSNLRLNESAEDLEKVYNFLIDNPELTVQINSHTDARGSFEYNEALSQRRAQSVVNYLVSRNIPIDRLVVKGYGERALINQCSNGVKCSEAEHQLNRRTEFQVINADGSTKIASDSRTDITINPCTDCPF